MMRCQELFEFALFEGCGISFGEMLESREYRTLIATEFTRFTEYATDDRRELFHAGPFRTSTMFYRMLNEQETPNDLPPVPHRQDIVELLEERAALRFLGGKLAEVAVTKLPARVRMQATRFRRNKSIRGKILAATELFCSLLDLKEQYPRITEIEVDDDGDVTSESPVKKTDYHDSLPKHFDTFGTGSLMPACLGMAMMLVGWAKKAKADYVIVNLLVSDESRIREVERILLSPIMDKVAKGEIVLRKGLVNWIRSLSEQIKEDVRFDFHPTIAVRIASGWLYLDPYLQYHGIPSLSTWNFQGAIEGFNEVASEAQPGATVVVHDHEGLALWLNNIFMVIPAIIEAGEKLMTEIEGEHYSAEDFQQLLKHNPLLSPLYHGLTVENPVPAPEEAVEKGMFGYAFDAKVRPETLARRWQRFEESPRYQQHVKEALLGLYYLSVLRYFYNRLEERKVRSNYLPESVELAEPDLALALQLMNNLNCHGPVQADLAPLILRHTSSQILWHDAILGRNALDDDEEVNMLAQDALTMLATVSPHLHGYCREELERLKG